MTALSTLTEWQLRSIEDLLSNDESSSDDDLQKYLVEQVDLTMGQAAAAMAYRPLYRDNIYIGHNTPIRAGAAAKPFDPREAQH